MRLNKRFLAILLLACTVVACDDDTTPTAPAPPTMVTETFTGTITPNGAAIHTFTVSASGTVKATLKAVGTDNTLQVGFALGNWFAEACSIVLANEKATGGTVLSGTITGGGSLCTRIGDNGNLAAGQTVAYTIEVEHP